MNDARLVAGCVDRCTLSFVQSFLSNLLYAFAIYRYFLNPEAVSVHLYCSICQEVFDCPQRAPCGHSFCKKVCFPKTVHGAGCRLFA